MSSPKVLEESKFKSWWRPAAGWVYLFICLFDFVLATILWSLLQTYESGKVTDQWDPLTLQGAGMFHISMGAILGVAAWTRGQALVATINKQKLPDTDYEDADARPRPSMRDKS